MDGFFTDILPGGLGTSAESVAGAQQSSFLIALIRNGLVLFFAVIVIAAIVYAAYSGLKFIRSQGASEKVEEATEAIKYTLIGLGVAFLGVIAVVIISSVFADGSDVSNAIDCFFELNVDSQACDPPEEQ